jgi:hypothetical protein
VTITHTSFAFQRPTLLGICSVDARPARPLLHAQRRRTRTTRRKPWVASAPRRSRRCVYRRRSRACAFACRPPASFPSGATRGRHRTRETARRRERFRGTASPSRGRETRERAGTSSRVFDRTGAVALGGVARSSVPRRASRRARPVAKTFRVLHACERFFLLSIASLVARAS